MKKLLFITPCYSDRTGGTKYNRKFVDIIKQNTEFSVDIIEDKDFGCTDWMRWYQAIKAYKNLYKTCANYDYVLIDAQKYTQLLFHISKMRRKNKNVKFIAICHHYDHHIRSGISRRLCKHFELKFLNMMDYIVYASEYTYSLKDKYIKPNVKNVLIKLAVPQRICNRTTWQGNQFCTIGGANYGKRKGHAELMHALNIAKANMPNFKLKIIGSYKPEEQNFVEVQNLMDKYNLNENVEYTGFVETGELNNILESSKFYVFPSLYEGYGMSMVEAMQCGLPVVAFNRSAMPTVVTDGVTGFLCNSIEEFANKTQLLYNNDALCEKMGKAAMEYAKTLQTEKDFEHDVNNFILTLI